MESNIVGMRGYCKIFIVFNQIINVESMSNAICVINCDSLHFLARYLLFCLFDMCVILQNYFWADCKQIKLRILVI